MSVIIKGMDKPTHCTEYGEIADYLKGLPGGAAAPSGRGLNFDFDSCTILPGSVKWFANEGQETDCHTSARRWFAMTGRKRRRRGNSFSQPHGRQLPQRGSQRGAYLLYNACARFLRDFLTPNVTTTRQAKGRGK